MKQEETIIIDFSDFHSPTKEELQASKRPISEIIKPVVEYSLDGEILNTYDNCADAGRALGIRADVIRECCVGKNNKYCKKLQRIFLYRGDDIAERLKILDEREEKKWKHGLARSVDEYNLKGRLLMVYPSQKFAAKVNKVSSYAIGACCNCKEKYLYIGNRIFLHHGDDIKKRLPLVKKKLFFESQRKNKCKPIDEYTIDGKFVRTYISASEAGRVCGIHFSAILRCCHGIEGHGRNFFTTHNKIFLFAGESISERLEQIYNRKNKSKLKLC